MAEKNIAVAISYDKTMPAPFVIAKGKGMLAEKIIDIAKRENVELVSDDIADKAYELFKPGSYIPEEVYEAVASIFAFVYTINEKSKKDML
ncbi:EscU/YscU/HrcU family type III secretion system export apparatus switch protein [Spirochaetia bacterium 38H-sp]|uniref:EscU/YscU/HrcU family type III secretion system export apparatus switch protein n=1 Tax=Rarispira pelagica TaxID=3141764 RepID=A0ABU9UB26_9SPIR